MKKFILLLMLITGFNGSSQDCIPPTLHVEEITGDCPSTGQVTLIVGAIDFGNATSVELYIYNLTTDSPESIIINDVNVFFPFGPYPAGTQLEIMGIHNELRCISEPILQIISSCSNLDLDKDGFTADVDCDDSRSAINPGATEICDRRDNNCDGNIDEGVSFIFYYDADQDDFGDPNRPVKSCNPEPTGFLIDNNLDCDDSDFDIKPGADEICGDDIDNNCDGNIDEGCEGCPDADSDGVCDDVDNCPNTANADQADADNDGLGDACDDCPNDPNKIALGDCGCGTPDTDSDSDGVADCNDSEINSPCPNNVDANGVSVDTDGDGVCDDVDNCVGTANSNQTDTDNDGIGDACDTCPNDNTNTCNDCTAGDSDNDGICDDIDNCSNLANPNQESDADCDGVPTTLDCNDNDPSITALNTTDSDNDGTPDCLDNCPNDRTKTEPGACGCGNRDNDRDGDGVADCNDLEINSPCPGAVNANGVSLDSDGDTVPDCKDLCPGFDDRLDDDGDKIPNGCDSNPFCRGDKLVICHENKGKYTTLCVSPSQLQRHATHPNDNLDGPCPDTVIANVIYEDENIEDTSSLRLSSSVSSLKIYPNPFNSNGIWLRTALIEKDEVWQLAIYDISGREIAKTNIKVQLNKNKYFWNLSHKNWDDGIYFLHIKSQSEEIKFKIIK